METRLENRVGNPIMKLVKGERLPSLLYRSNCCGHDFYGNNGGVSPPTPTSGFNLITTANPTPGVCSLIVNASDTEENDGRSDSGVFSDASYTLRVRYPVPSDLNFSANLKNWSRSRMSICVASGGTTFPCSSSPVNSRKSPRMSLWRK